MSSLQQSTNAFDALPIRQAVFRQTFPAIASQMITLIYNLADTYFVGMLNQPSQTAAITVVYSPFSCSLPSPTCLAWAAPAPWPGHWGEGPDEARRIASISFWSAFSAGPFSAFSSGASGSPFSFSAAPPRTPFPSPWATPNGWW